VGIYERLGCKNVAMSKDNPSLSLAYIPPEQCDGVLPTLYPVNYWYCNSTRLV
jgi:hypothetical protein